MHGQMNVKKYFTATLIITKTTKATNYYCGKTLRFLGYKLV